MKILLKFCIKEGNPRHPVTAMDFPKIEGKIHVPPRLFFLEGFSSSQKGFFNGSQPLEKPCSIWKIKGKVSIRCDHWVIMTHLIDGCPRLPKVKLQVYNIWLISVEDQN